MRKSVFTFCLLLIVVALSAQDTAQKITYGRFNSAEQQQKPYVILMSVDGLRWDFIQKYHAENLINLGGGGVTASSMIPSFPSLTFPNHYTIATGLYPAHHGLVNNSFYDEDKKAFYAMSNKAAVRDSSWYGGTPLWVLAEEQKMLSASFYWVGSEAAEHGIFPTYTYYYNEAIGIDRRIEVVKNWLQLPENRRPHFIAFYFPQVDHAAHLFGPDSKETAMAVQFVDSAVAKMVATVSTLNLPVNYILVSDHGMTQVDTDNTLPLPAVIDTSKFIVPNGDALLQLYAKDKNDVLPTYKQLKATAKDYDVYLTTNTPAHWHYSKKDDYYNRVGDIILTPHLPKVFNIKNRKITPGKHGFDPKMEDMHATFMAWGPAFKQGKKLHAFENVHVYPLVAKILGLTYTGKIDGRLSVLKKALK